MSKSQFPKKRKLGCRTQLRAAAGAGRGGGAVKGELGGSGQVVVSHRTTCYSQHRDCGCGHSGHNCGH